MGSIQDPVAKSSLDPAWTEMVISSMGPGTDPRLRELAGSFIRHAHEFCKETKISTDEWQNGMAFINEIGKASTPLINELQIVLDCIGIETIVDEMTHANPNATPHAVLGPFYRDDAPIRQKGSSIIEKDHGQGEVIYVYGKVLDSNSKKPVPDAELDVWQSSTNGLYDQQDQEQKPGNLRGRFRIDKDGSYGFYCLKPTPYPIDSNSPAAKMLSATDRHFYRPAHIHASITHAGYTNLVTQLYPSDDPYLRSDAACAVMNALIIDYKPREGDPKAKQEVEYDFFVTPK